MYEIHLVYPLLRLDVAHGVQDPQFRTTCFRQINVRFIQKYNLYLQYVHHLVILNYAAV
jgi:hypothetical protein